MRSPNRRLCVRPALLLALALLLAPALPAPGQQLLRGRVVLGEEGMAGVPVELHRVTRDTAGVLGTAVTGPDGAFSFRTPPPDTMGFTVLFATADFRGVRYFGGPLHPGQPLAGYTVQVFDTVSAAAAPGAVRVARRDVIVLPGDDGSAEVDEILLLHNGGDRTLVGAGGAGVWEFRLPAGAAAFQAGDGRISPQSVQRMGDRVFLTGSLPPGAHELFIRYRLGRGERRTVLPLAPGTDSVNLFVRQPSPELRVAGLGDPVPVDVERERFLHYAGAGLQQRTELALEWDRPAPPPVDPRVAAVAVTGILLAAGAGIALRRGGRRG